MNEKFVKIIKKQLMEKSLSKNFTSIRDDIQEEWNINNTIISEILANDNYEIREYLQKESIHQYEYYCNALNNLNNGNISEIEKFISLDLKSLNLLSKIHNTKELQDLIEELSNHGWCLPFELSQEQLISLNLHSWDNYFVTYYNYNDSKELKNLLNYIDITLKNDTNLERYSNLFKESCHAYNNKPELFMTIQKKLWTD